ncbi:MAG: RluA family pseudouridine synthase [Desulfobulbaceae bacterium]|nr:RluA family pseudouridine synthase [Desulfobulbaceae bacterium]
MRKGAVFLSRKKKGKKRLRRATTELRPGDLLEFNYDEKVLAGTPPVAECLHDEKHYSVWFKPAGLLAQGTNLGDHCSLPRQAELHFQPPRQIFPVHRLDREASGLMLLAHSKEAAAKLSLLFQENLIDKRYQLLVIGKPEPEGVIDLALDGKKASTSYRLLAHDPTTDTATVEATIATGRLHQIRRHFTLIGHPVLGDPRYGEGNKNRSGLKLVACRLSFKCPLSGQQKNYTVDRSHTLA